jgi:Mg2+-importing ATPase
MLTGESSLASPMHGSIEQLMAELRSSIDGLTSEQAVERLQRHGPNEPKPVQRTGPLRELIRFLANPLVLILLAASLVSAFLGQILDACIIAAMIVLSVVLNFLQAYRSQQAVRRLQEKVAGTATVRRDGQWCEVPRRTVVPGDVVRLGAGDMIPADARLLVSHHLFVQQAALTGESMPAEKTAVPELTSPTSATSPGLVFLGTSVANGSAEAVVYATGRNTAFGDIAVRLASRPPETEFDRGTRKFGFLILETVFFLVLFILLVNLWEHHNPIESLLFAVALAVGLTPEFLPMITTVTLSIGAVRMAERKVIVKHLVAIEDFGSIDVLCSDKTGTLTVGEMRLDSSVDPHGRLSQRPLSLGWLNSHFQTGINNPLETAILSMRGDAATFNKVDEIPFDFERRRLSVALKNPDGLILITKGAPETVMDVCSKFELNGTEALIDDLASKLCTTTFQSLSAQGFRMLAISYKQMPRSAGLTINDESEMTLAGFLSFRDPPKEGVVEVIEALRRDGIEIKILTGDNEMVARHVCTRVGLDGTRVVLGDEIDRMTDAALEHAAEQTSVFARVSPAQKNRIIQALKRRSHVVGFLGDGINDAPSLHTADVGISVAGAVDVARDAADLILLEPGLDVLHAGIIEGRKAFGNVLKYLLMGTSSNFGNMFSMAGASVFLPFLPMLPTQILLNNFLYDLAQVTIPSDNVDPAYIRKPQRWDIRLIRNFMVMIGPISSIYDFLTFYILLRIFHASEAFFHTGWFVESLATQTLVVFVIRTAAKPWSSRPSRALSITVLTVVAIGLAIPFSPLAEPLGFTLLPAEFYVFLILFVGTYLALVELVKRWLVQRALEGPVQRQRHQSKPEGQGQPVPDGRQRAAVN